MSQQPFKQITAPLHSCASAGNLGSAPNLSFGKRSLIKLCLYRTVDAARLTARLRVAHFAGLITFLQEKQSRGKKNPLKQSETLSHCSGLGMCREMAKKRGLNNLEPDQGGWCAPTWGGIILPASAIVGVGPLWFQQHNPLMTGTPFRCSRLVFPHLPGREGCDKPDRGPPGWRGSAGGREPMGGLITIPDRCAACTSCVQGVPAFTRAADRQSCSVKPCCSFVMVWGGQRLGG